MKQGVFLNKGVDRRAVGRPALYPSVKKGILDLIKSSRLVPSSPLESERDLCARFGASRPLIRRALGELKREGRIESLPGKGHFVASHPGTIMPGVVSLLLGSTASPGGMRLDSHVMGITEGVERALENSPIRVVLETVGPQHRPVSDMVKPHLTDLRGVVLVPLSNQSVEGMVKAIPAGVKCVVAGRPTGHLGVPSVRVDQADGIRRGVQYLVGQGHERIGYVRLSENSWPDIERYQAFRSALAEQSITHQRELEVCCVDDGEQIEQAVSSLVHRNKDMTAVLVSCSSILSRLFRVFSREGIEIPNDLSLVSFDDLSVTREHLPPITVIRQPSVRLGWLAGQVLLQCLAGNDPDPMETVLPTELIVRDSAASRINTGQR